MAFAVQEPAAPTYASAMPTQLPSRSSEFDSQRPPLSAWMPETSPLADPGNWQAFFGRVAGERLAGRVDKNELADLRARAPAGLGLNTLQGRALAMAHGGAHRFDVLDDIQTEHLGKDEVSAVWDSYFQDQGFAQAIRGRIGLLQRVLRDLMTWGRGAQIQVLSLGCGACRDIEAFLRAFPQAPVVFTAVDADVRALERAQALCAPWSHQVNLLRGNALRLRVSSHTKFDLVWCAGLMDNLDDRSFVVLLNQMLEMARPDMGQVVLDNLSPAAPERAYLHWLDWPVVARNATQLAALASQCGVLDWAQNLEAGPQGASQVLRVSVGL